jgi:hypothetical protein
MGYALPLTLLSSDPKNNPQGHWESLPIVQLNEEILSYLGSNWLGIESVTNDWHSSADFSNFTVRAVEALKQEFGQAERFVLKDPRVCRLLPFWRNALETQDIDLQLIYITRAPAEVAQSLYLRDGILPALGELVWLRNVLDAELAGRQTKRVHVSYRNLVESNDSEISRIWDALTHGRDLVMPPNIREGSILIRPDLRHHHDCDVATKGLPAKWIRAVSDILDRWSTLGEDGRDFAVLDDARSMFDTMIESYGYLLNASIGSICFTRHLVARAVAPSHAPDETGLHAATVFIRASTLFDAEWYLQRYPDVAAAGIDPASHFVRVGDAELRDPGPQFSTSRYLEAHSDVANAGINALVHYMVYGAQEGRAMFPPL